MRCVARSRTERFGLFRPLLPAPVGGARRLGRGRYGVMQGTAPTRASRSPPLPEPGEVRRSDGAAGARAAQIAHLQAQIGRVRQEKGQLEERLGRLHADNRSLEAEAARLSRQIDTWRKVANRARHGEFWTLYQRFAAVHDDAEAYAETVNHDPTRIFAMCLLGELRARRASEALIAHAAKIVDLFDPFHYLTEQQDRTVAGENPLLHYVTVGYAERREPNPLFDPLYYLAQTGAVGGDPLLHYVGSGARQGLKPHPLFDGKYYLERNPDLAAQDVNPLAHYQTWGCHENRDPSPLFDIEYYLGQAGGVALLTGNALHDYLLLTWDAPDPHPLFCNRYVHAQLTPPLPGVAPLLAYETDSALWTKVRPHPLFDVDYLPQTLAIEYPAEISPLAYYCKSLDEYDVDPSVLFDSALYRYQVEKEQGQTLADAPIIDYLKRGYKNKKLRPNVIFDPAAYLSRNQIVVSGPELVLYCLNGDHRGYYCHELFSAGLYNAGRTDTAPITALEHFLLSDDAAAVESHPHVARTLDRRAIDFVLSAVHSPSDFDADFYKASYPDLQALSEVEARNHYYQSGKSEGRWGSPRGIVETLRIGEIPLGFFADEYLALNPDLQGEFKSDFFPLFTHYLTIRQDREPPHRPVAIPSRSTGDRNPDSKCPRRRSRRSRNTSTCACWFTSSTTICGLSSPDLPTASTRCRATFTSTSSTSPGASGSSASCGNCVRAPLSNYPMTMAAISAVLSGCSTMSTSSATPPSPSSAFEKEPGISRRSAERIGDGRS